MQSSGWTTGGRKVGWETMATLKVWCDKIGMVVVAVWMKRREDMYHGGVILFPLRTEFVFISEAIKSVVLLGNPQKMCSKLFCRNRACDLLTKWTHSVIKKTYVKWEAMIIILFSPIDFFIQSSTSPYSPSARDLRDITCSTLIHPSENNEAFLFWRWGNCSPESLSVQGDTKTVFSYSNFLWQETGQNSFRW